MTSENTIGRGIYNGIELADAPLGMPWFLSVVLQQRRGRKKPHKGVKRQLRWRHANATFGWAISALSSPKNYFRSVRRDQQYEVFSGSKPLAFLWLVVAAAAGGALGGTLVSGALWGPWWQVPAWIAALVVAAIAIRPARNCPNRYSICCAAARLGTGDRGPNRTGWGLVFFLKLRDF